MELDSLVTGKALPLHTYLTSPSQSLAWLFSSRTAHPPFVMRTYCLLHCSPLKTFFLYLLQRAIVTQCVPGSWFSGTVKSPRVLEGYTLGSQILVQSFISLMAPSQALHFSSSYIIRRKAKTS